MLCSTICFITVNAILAAWGMPPQLAHRGSKPCLKGRAARRGSLVCNSAQVYRCHSVPCTWSLLLSTLVDQRVRKRTRTHCSRPWKERLPDAWLFSACSRGAKHVTKRSCIFVCARTRFDVAYWSSGHSPHFHYHTHALWQRI